MVYDLLPVDENVIRWADGLVSCVPGMQLCVARWFCRTLGCFGLVPEGASAAAYVVHEWTYEAMVYGLLPVDENVIRWAEYFSWFSGS
jgi:hypothetical protein